MDSQPPGSHRAKASGGRKPRRGPAAETERPAWERRLLTRLQLAAGKRSFREVADLTDCHPETVRRYLTRGRPSGYFIARLCRALELAPAWVLFGHGPQNETYADKPGGFVEGRVTSGAQSSTHSASLGGADSVQEQPVA